MSRFIQPSAFFTVLLAVSVLLCGEPVDKPEVYRLGVPSRAGSGEGPLDWVYEKVNTSRDSWSGERASERLKKSLEKVSSWLVAGKVDPTTLQQLLAPGFRSTALVPKAWKETVDAGDNWSSWRSLDVGEPAAVTTAASWRIWIKRMSRACKAPKKLSR